MMVVKMIEQQTANQILERRDLIKKIFPKKILFLAVDILYPFFHKYYKYKFKTLIIRKGTTDRHIFRQMFITRDCRIPIQINPKLIIDCGAYTGISTLWFMKKYPEAKIIAVEPEESNFAILKKNTKQWKNIVLIKAGIWYKKSFLKIVDGGIGEWGFRTEEAKSLKDSDVKTITIDEILKQSKHDKIDILKIDIEGAEKELFENGCLWLDKVNILIIELHDRFKKGCSKSLYSKINKGDWNIYGNEANLVFVRKVGVGEW